MTPQADWKAATREATTKSAESRKKDFYTSIPAAGPMFVKPKAVKKGVATAMGKQKIMTSMTKAAAMSVVPAPWSLLASS